MSQEQKHTRESSLATIPFQVISTEVVSSCHLVPSILVPRSCISVPFHHFNSVLWKEARMFSCISMPPQLINIPKSSKKIITIIWEDGRIQEVYSVQGYRTEAWLVIRECKNENFLFNFFEVEKLSDHAKTHPRCGFIFACLSSDWKFEVFKISKYKLSDIIFQKRSNLWEVSGNRQEGFFTVQPKLTTDFGQTNHSLLQMIIKVVNIPLMYLSLDMGNFCTHLV